MKKAIINFADKVDSAVSKLNISLFEERCSVIVLLFHGLFEDSSQIARNHVDPQQRIVVSQFRTFIEYFLNSGYIFISSKDILEGLDESKKYVVVTFDDGYYNNNVSLPVLVEYKIPAIYFISTNHILQGKCFWWDVIYRERVRRGCSSQEISKEISSLKRLKNSEIELYIEKAFGNNAFRPIGDIDRPFTPDELHRFSMNPYVELGNHTRNHAILTNYSSAEIMEEISGAQDDIVKMTGIRPHVISYPNGNYSDEIIAISKELGLRLGIIVNCQKNYHPITEDNDRRFMLNRYILWGTKDIVSQCESFRSDVHIVNYLKKIFK
jgi:peptidoglycan/xylan/chitin deacetylase (PgdA/CDA1 family)